MPNENAKVIVSYVIAVVILTVYGGQVCPFLESLTPGGLVLILIGAFTLGFFIRGIVFKLFYKTMNISSVADIYAALWEYLLIDIGVWVFIGLMVTFWNMIFYEFPMGSGLKVVLGCGTIGFFSATYFALSYERQVIRASAESPDAVYRKPDRFFSISTKFLILLAVSYTVMAIIITLLVFKDLVYVIENVHVSPEFVFRAVAIEILFVFAIIFGGSLFIARQYGQNLRMMFDLQLRTLEEVSRGNYQTPVPVVSSDEFGLIADHSNQMIQGLREKERIRSVFGKYLSPSVATAVLESEEGANLGGRRVNVAVLFIDIRNYTALSEKITPEETVRLLNGYFDLMVHQIHAASGVVDKFIGDAVMGVFGLEGTEQPCEAALDAAQGIMDNLENLNRDLAADGLPALRIGIGIHYGPVVAGNIGSQERLEYTVIGDAVNIASRLESLTKEVDAEIALSADVFERLSPERQSSLVSLGSYVLKGKTKEIAVYGV